MNKPLSAFSVVEGPHHCLHLRDINGKVSVTNDAENVVPFVLDIFQKAARKKAGSAGGKEAMQCRIFYRDSDKKWSELKHDGFKFTVFAVIEYQDRENFGIPADSK